jgi:hypothetical protein
MKSEKRISFVLVLIVGLQPAFWGKDRNIRKDESFNALILYSKLVGNREKAITGLMVYLFVDTP